MNIGRNDPCPCGSGRKYKHCCLAKANVVVVESDAIAAQRKAHEWLRARFGKKKQGDIAEDYLGVIAEFWPDDDDPIAAFLDGLDEGAGYTLDTGIGDWALHETEYERRGTSARGIDWVREAADLRLTAPQRAFLEASARAPLHIYEAVAVETDRGLHLRDVLQPDRTTLFVHEKAATHGLCAGSLIGARVIELHDRLELGGVIYPLSPINVLEILLDEDFAADAENRHTSLTDLIRDSWLYDHVKSPLERARPSSRPSFFEDRFEVVDAAALDLALESNDAIRRMNGGDDSMWIYDPGDNADVQVMAYRRSEIGETDFSVFVLRNPDELAADAGRAWLESAIGAGVRHVERAHVEPGPEDWFRLPLPADIANAADASPDAEQVRAELIDRYADWCDTPLGILGERAPHAMLTEATDRYRVELLLRVYDDVEAAFAKQASRAPVLFDFLRERLGLRAEI